MKLKDASKSVIEYLKNIHQILLAVGMIIAMLISGWQYTKNTIIENERETLKMILSQSVKELGLVTDSTLSVKIRNLEEVQLAKINPMLDLHYTQLLKMDSINATLRSISYSIKRNRSEIDDLTDMIVVISDQIGGNAKKLTTVANNTEYSDSLQYELETVRLQFEIDKILGLLKKQHKETVYGINGLIKDEGVRGYRSPRSKITRN